MNITFKLNNLNKKNDAQLDKEMNRRGLQWRGKTKNDKICEIIAYDAYNAGRSDYKQEVKKTEKKPANNVHPIKINGVTATKVNGVTKITFNNKPERNTVILTYQEETNAYLKVTEDQKRVIKWLIDNDWMLDTEMKEVPDLQWVEP